MRHYTKPNGMYVNARRTGRTTRMLREVIKCAAERFYRKVVVVASTGNIANTFRMQLRELAGGSVPPNVIIMSYPEWVDNSDYDVEEALRRASGEYGVAGSLFIDHDVLEVRYREVLQELHRYDVEPLPVAGRAAALAALAATALADHHRAGHDDTAAATAQALTSEAALMNAIVALDAADSEVNGLKSLIEEERQTNAGLTRRIDMQGRMLQEILARHPDVQDVVNGWTIKFIDAQQSRAVGDGVTGD